MAYSALIDIFPVILHTWQKRLDLIPLTVIFHTKTKTGACLPGFCYEGRRSEQTSLPKDAIFKWEVTSNFKCILYFFERLPYHWVSRHKFQITKWCAGIMTNKSCKNLKYSDGPCPFSSSDPATKIFFWWEESRPASTILINQLSNASLFQLVKWLLITTFNFRLINAYSHRDFNSDLQAPTWRCYLLS